jgi:hypothetical protein
MLRHVMTTARATASEGLQTFRLMAYAQLFESLRHRRAFDVPTVLVRFPRAPRRRGCAKLVSASCGAFVHQVARPSLRSRLGILKWLYPYSGSRQRAPASLPAGD